MRRGLTLIEMIFSMVIIAIVFTVVPKIIFASNKSTQLSIKEDALFNALTLIRSIARLPWDQNTIDNEGAILNAGGLTCKADGYRVGGFKGSRNCLNNVSAGVTMTQEGYDDIDDYHGDSIVTSGGRIAYTLDTVVTHEDDIKHIIVSVSASDKRLGKSFKSSFFYDSANLGHIQINKRAW
ncbi:MAG: type II secretion system protein [Campylobacterota bacterium]|nr:type II secretion system protein [Campylobacterota bacterium]